MQSLKELISGPLDERVSTGKGSLSDRSQTRMTYVPEVVYDREFGEHAGSWKDPSPAWQAARAISEKNVSVVI